MCFICNETPTEPLGWDVMHIYGWQLLAAACHYPEKFGDKKFLANGQEIISQPQKFTIWEEVPKK